MKPAWILPSALAVAAIWVVLFELNGWLFSSMQRTPFVSWIFLPAALRMLAVLSLGWAGALGLFAGAAITNASMWSQDWRHALVLSAVSALPVLLASEAVRRALALPSSLVGMRTLHLLWFSGAGAIASVTAHNVFFFITGHSESLVQHLLPMLVGDMLGMFIVLYIASRVLRRVSLPPIRKV